MKKLIALTVCLAMTAGLLSAARAGEIAAANQQPQPETLRVGSLSQMSGHFFTDLWGNNTSDMDVRALIHGYGTVAWSAEGHYAVDATAVQEVSVTEQGGDRTYLFTLNDGLTYNDGTPITAKDYVFSALLTSDPRLTSLGSAFSAMRHLAGADRYAEDVLRTMDPGDAEPAPAVFSGVRLLGEREFSLTIDSEYLPYFYELALVGVTPYPMSVIAPGCDVKDDGEGSYIDGPLTQELLRQTVLDPESGYLFRPTITGGPYTLASYAAEAHVATLERNERYLGNFEGWLPVFDRLVFAQADPATMLDDLRSGKIDVINKVSAGERIQAGMELVLNEELGVQNYPRAGLSYLSFACERELTASASLRKAVAMCVDIEALCDEALRGFGLPVFGYYGMGQWMADESQDELLSLAMYSLNLNAARELLESEGWTLDAEGNPYDERIGGSRYRQAEDGQLQELYLRWATPEGAEIVTPLADMLKSNAEAIGMRIEETRLPFAELLRHYYRQTDRVYDLFFMGSNFALVFDPFDSFHTGDAFQGVFNTTGIRDEELMRLAANMRQTAPDDTEGYKEKWVAFQQHWIDVLPMAPLYSNVYFDFFRRDLQNYHPNANWSWASAILYAYVGEPVEEALPEALPGGGEEELFFEE